MMYQKSACGMGKKSDPNQLIWSNVWCPYGIFVGSSMKQVIHVVLLCWVKLR